MDWLFIFLISIFVQLVLAWTSKKIHYAYPWYYVLATTVLAIPIWEIIYAKTGFSILFFTLAFVQSLLLASSAIDLIYQEIPDSYNLAIALLGVVFILHFHTFTGSLVLGGVIAFTVFLILSMITGAVGGGDVKMAGAVGLFLGVGLMTKFMIYSFLSGAIIALILLLMGKKKNYQFAFGPFIAMTSIYLILTSL